MSANGAVGATSNWRIALIAVALVLAVAADLGLLFAADMQLAPMAVLASAHFLVGPLFWLVGRQRGETTIATIGLVAITVMGPLGALGCLFLAINLRNTGQSNVEDKGWYSVLSAHEQREQDLPKELWQSISEGRARELATTTPMTDFQQIMSKGSVAQQQAMLGVISKQFDPAYSDVLKTALRSEEPVVRVSAAAVFSKLRETNRKRMIAGADDPDILEKDKAIERGMALARGAFSGLVDAAAADKARVEALQILQSVRPAATVADAIEEVICTLLIGAGHDREIEQRLAGLDVSDFSVLRDLKLRALMRTGNYRDIPEALFKKRSNAIRLDRARYNKDNRALLALSDDSGK